MGSRKRPRAKDLTQQYLEGDFDEDKRLERLDGKDKTARQQKIDETAALRSVADAAENLTLPRGRVRQVFSLYIEVLLEDGQKVLCTVRKTMNKRRDTTAVVGDFVRVRVQRKLDAGVLEGVIELVEPRKTVLTRADSFKALVQQPIVANATRMMIVVAVAMPRPKWGLVDRMLVAAAGGGLEPVVCLNKIDLGGEFPELLAEAREVLAHYRTLGVRAEETCATESGSEAILRALLIGQSTVLAGHSGVGKSSLVRLVAPKLDIRIGDVSTVTEKGRHTTTSAKVYLLPGPDGEPGTGGEVIDTPGVKLFGLWNVTPDSLDEHFPDVTAGTAPQWRVESRDRIAESLQK